MNDLADKSPKPGRKEDMAFSYLALALLAPYAENARTHSKRQIRQLADSMSAFGLGAPILIHEENTVLAGHAHLEAAKRFRKAFALARWSDDPKLWFVPGKAAAQRVDHWLERESAQTDAYADATYHRGCFTHASPRYAIW